METLILSHRDLRPLLSMNSVIPAVEQAFASYAQGTAQMPAKVYLSLPAHYGDFRAMPAYMVSGQTPIAGVKWVNSHPENPMRNKLPSVMGVYILSDPVTALPLAIMDATLLTAARTGAAAAVATKHLFGKSPKSIGFVGCGVQARYMYQAHKTLGEFQALLSDVVPENAQRFADELGANARVAPIEETSGCDVLCVATPGKTIAVKYGWLRNGVHINAMGADAPGKQELDPEILRHAKVVVDDYEQATHSGEVNVPIHHETFDPKEICATLGEVITKQKVARTSDEITVFDSTGLAVQDVAVAWAVYQEAKRGGIGTTVSLVPT